MVETLLAVLVGLLLAVIAQVVVTVPVVLRRSPDAPTEWRDDASERSVTRDGPTGAAPRGAASGPSVLVVLALLMLAIATRSRR